MSGETLPKRYNIDSFTDTRVRRQFKWLADGVLVDLAGWTGRLRIGQNGVYLQEVVNGATIDGSDVVTMTIPADTLPAGTYWYVLDLIDPSANPVRLVNGTLRVTGAFQ